jgi:hypothetical protein
MTISSRQHCGNLFLFIGLILLFFTLFIPTGCNHQVTNTVSTIPTTTAVQSSPNDIDNDGITDSVEDELIRKFAPVVKLHPSEQYLPAETSWYIMRIKMSFDVRLGPDPQLLKKGEVSIGSLLNQTYHEQTSGLSTTATNFFLEQTDINNGDSLDNYRKETRKGKEPSDWICYTHVRFAPSDHAGMYDIQYIFFYAYNGDMAWGPIESAHEADFEHITVRVENNLNDIHAIYYAAHDGEGKWYARQTSPGLNDGYSLTANGRPIVYSGLDSHASYPWATQWKRTEKPDDYTADNGREWDCSSRVVNLGEKSFPRQDMKWIQYSGHWGEIGQFSWTTGPYGPAYQSWWNSDPN